MPGNHAWHVTPTENVDAIKQTGLRESLPEPDGDLAVSLFKTRSDAVRESNVWLRNKHAGKPLTLIQVDIDGLALTETFPFELITTGGGIGPERLVAFSDF